MQDENYFNKILKSLLLDLHECSLTLFYHINIKLRKKIRFWNQKLNHQGGQDSLKKNYPEIQFLPMASNLSAIN